MRRSISVLVATGAVVALASTAACSGSSSGGSGGDSGTPSGSITVLTNRTDLNQDGTLKKYAADFQKVYPKVTVNFQAITDYEGEVKTRMNTDNYGDVLLIPPSISRADFPKFFEPLGDASTLGQKYNWVSFGTKDGSAGGKVYGVATFGNASGFVYNKRIWQQAGITSYPSTPDEMLSDLQAIKDKTKAIPYYTNYHDGWPVQGWSNALGSPNCDTDANAQMATDKTPFASDKDPGKIYTLLYDIVNKKLVEQDPTTTNWENSKTLIGTGKTATMWLGTWAITQMQAAAKTAGADPADIGFMPYPEQQGGKFCAVTGPDYLQAVNVHSSHKAAAKAWITWFTEKSGFADSQGSISTLKGSPMPPTLKDFDAAGVKYIELDQSEAGVVSKVDNESEVGFFSSPNTAQHLVDVARGAAGGSLLGVLDDLNKKWADAISVVGS